MLSIEVVGVYNILFKARKTDGTLIYNESITTNIVFANDTSYGQIEAGVISTKGTPTGLSYILAISSMGYWLEKPNFLNDF
jgi:hypothetical protein